MADEESGPGRIPGLIQDFVSQLRGMIAGLEDVAGRAEHLPQVPSLRSLPGMKDVPLPGAMSAAQLSTVASTVAAQRRSIEALTAQLSAFDDQLAVLERLIGPLTEWSKTWAELEDRLMTLGRGSGTEGGPGGEDRPSAQAQPGSDGPAGDS